MEPITEVDNLVDGLVQKIEARVLSRLETLITQSIAQRLDTIDYDKKVNYLASAKLDNVIAGMEVDQSRIQQRLDLVADVVVNNFEAEARRMAAEHVKKKLYNDMDINHVVREIVATEIGGKLSTFAFPRGSIKGETIDARTLSISGDQIKGGVIKDFASNGIEDKSSQVQMTLLDAGVVIENKMITLGLEVKGQTVIEGDLHIKGDVPPDSQFFKQIIKHSIAGVKESLNEELFQGFSYTLFERIRDSGIDLKTITMDGQAIIDGNKLNAGITETNITRLGVVKDLQTTGEALMSDTFYVGNKRVGVNTIEPKHSLSIWDQEVEVGVGKRQRDTAWIGTPRDQDVILSAANKDNIVLTKDGSVQIDNLVLNGVQFGMSTGTPNHSAPKGSVLFNSNPSPGSPAGWISLGGAAWTRFGSLA
jgi:hypothetical protein